MGNLGRCWDLGEAGQNSTFFTCQTLSCHLSFGLGYGSWSLSHGPFLESVGTFSAAPYSMVIELRRQTFEHHQPCMQPCGFQL